MVGKTEQHPADHIREQLLNKFTGEGRIKVIFFGLALTGFILNILGITMPVFIWTLLYIAVGILAGLYIAVVKINAAMDSLKIAMDIADDKNLDS